MKSEIGQYGVPCIRTVSKRAGGWERWNISREEDAEGDDILRRQWRRMRWREDERMEEEEEGETGKTGLVGDVEELEDLRKTRRRRRKIWKRKRMRMKKSRKRMIRRKRNHDTDEKGEKVLERQ